MASHFLLRRNRLSRPETSAHAPTLRSVRDLTTGSYYPERTDAGSVATVRCLILTGMIFAIAGCSNGSHSVSDSAEPPARKSALTRHPQVDFEHWADIFPLESFHKTSGPRHWDSNPNDPVDLWKPGGQIITSPAHLCEVELVRKQYAQSQNLGRAVPVDLFLWSIEPPKQPFLTRLGGTPHRESTKPWPTEAGQPFTFVAQFCFADSRDVVSARIPGDVMLVFFRNAESPSGEESVYIEWSALELNSPMSAGQCPPPSFTVPQLSGHIYRTLEYPDSFEVFEQAGHESCYLLSTTQATKIGRETWFIQNDPREPDDELLCTLNSIHPTTYPRGAKWPLIGLETLPTDWKMPEDDYGWGKYEMMFGDVGCIYFLIDRSGSVTWAWDCY